MKILAFSDWRIQSFQMARDIIQSEQPDLILYGGDDVIRIIGFNQDKIYIKTPNYFIACDLNYPVIFLQNEEVAKKAPWIKFFNAIHSYQSDSIYDLKIPFLYVVGNDDFVIENHGKLFLRISRGFPVEGTRYVIYENQEDKVDLISSVEFRELKEDPHYIMKVLNELEKFHPIAKQRKKELERKGIEVYEYNGIYYTSDVENFYRNPASQYNLNNGFYIEINPDYGKQIKTINKESISIFGSGCTVGLQSEIIQPPTEYADIFLSHIPPLGSLDLSKRFGINHIGSDELLQSIQAFQPKFVICGHSHIWGGLTKQIGKSTILNVSSHDNLQYRHEGHFALINTEDWSYQVVLDRDIDRGLISPYEIRGGRTLYKNLKRKSRLYFEWEMYQELTVNREKLFTHLRPLLSFGDGKPYFNLSRITCEDDLHPQSKEFLVDEFSINLKDFLNVAKEIEMLCDNLYKKRPIKEIYTLLNRIEDLGIDTKTYRSRLESIDQKTPSINRSISLNPEEHWFVDVETGLASREGPGRLWLIGIGDGLTEEVCQFRYPEEKEDFFKFIEEEQITTLVSWTNYDPRTLHPILNQNKVGITFLDACQRVAYAINIYTHKLHELYDIICPDDPTPEELIPGRIAGLYADHLIFDESHCPNCSSRKDEILNTIIERNKLDIVQTIRLCKRLYNEEEFICPYCKKKFNEIYYRNRHLENKVCRKHKKKR